MKFPRLFSLAAGCALAITVIPSASATTRALADYPLRVHVYSTNWHSNAPYFFSDIDVSYGYQGYGRANLTDGTNTNAMEYTFACDHHFLRSDPDEAFPARWRKPDHEIEMLMGEIGSEKTTTCRMKVTLKDYVYHRLNGHLITLTQEEYKQREAHEAERAESLAPADTDGSHYPMQFSLLDVTWNPRNGGIYVGSGHGNLQTAQGLSSVDFDISCPVRVNTTPQGRFYSAKWVVEGHEMKILMRNLNDPSIAATCNLKTQVHSDVYIVESAGVLKTVSPEKYKALRAADATP
jgi:hypothetical protein